MGLRAGGLQRKSKAASEIPSSSMADIAFLLLIFFMVTTVFRNDKERPIEFPEAQAIEKIDKKQKDILNLWVEQDGIVYMNDVQYTMDQVGGVIFPIYVANRELVVSIRSDRNAPYSFIDQLTKELQAAGALKVMFAADLENTMTRQRR